MRRSFVTAAVTAAFFAGTPSVFAGDDKPEAKNIIYPDTGLTVADYLSKNDTKPPPPDGPMMSCSCTYYMRGSMPR